LCQICGNYIYEGRRAYEKHFRESRHEQGMMALSIPNTKIFFEINFIDKGMILWKFLKQIREFNKGYAIEFEDQDGNVYDKKTFELLIKQGIV